MTLSSLIVAVLLAAPGGAANSDSAVVADADLQAAGMFRLWDARLPLPAGDQPIAGYLVDGSLYIVSDGGLIFALEAETGLIRWAHHVAQHDYVVYRPTHLRTVEGPGLVAIATTTRVFLFNRYSGDLLQSFTPRFPPSTSALGYDDRLFMGGADGRFYSLQLGYGLLERPFQRWEVLAGGPVTTAPVLFGEETLIFASQGGSVFSCLSEDKTLRWSFRTGGPIVADPAVDETGVYVASTDRSLYRIDHAGRMGWRLRLPRPLTDGPIVRAQTVYQRVSGQGMLAIDADSGAEKWRFPDGRRFVSHSVEGVLLVTDRQQIAVVDHESGSLRHLIPTAGLAAAVVNTRDDATYLMGRGGEVLCARISGVPYLRRQQVLAARARLTRPPETRETLSDRHEVAEPDRPATWIELFRSRRDRTP